MEGKKLIPAPIDEKHVSIDFATSLFDRVELEEQRDGMERYKGEWFELKYKTTSNVIAIRPTIPLSESRWWDLYLELNEIFDDYCDEDIVVDIENEVETGSIYLWFYLKV